MYIILLLTMRVNARGIEEERSVAIDALSDAASDSDIGLRKKISYIDIRYIFHCSANSGVERYLSPVSGSRTTMVFPSF